MGLRVAKHAGILIATILVGGFLAATLVRFAPGFETDSRELDSRLSSESIASLRAAREQDRNIFRFYGRYLAGMAAGDLGTSRSLERPITELLRQRLPVTAASMAYALAVGWIAGLGLAVVVAAFENRAVDLTAGFATTILLCIPGAALAFLVLAFGRPARLAMALMIFPQIFRYSRSLLGRSYRMSHILMARAKGLRGWRILVWHVLPTAAPEMIALAGISITLAFGAAIPVEVICDSPGVGQLAWRAAMNRDLPLLVNITLIVTALTLLANSASDIMAYPLRRTRA